MKKIKINYSACECEPWTDELEVKKDDINLGIIYCKTDDPRIKQTDGYVMIPMDEAFYKENYDGTKHYRIGNEKCHEMSIWVEWSDVKEWMDTTPCDDIYWTAS